MAKLRRKKKRKEVKPNDGFLPKLYIAIPALNERAYLPATLKSIASQTYKNFEVFVCVNQPNDWCYDDSKAEICENNYKTLEYLKAYNKLPIRIIDRASKGHGWKEKQGGVGWARKVLMDDIAERAEPTDIIISLDADTTFYPQYFEAVKDIFKRYEDITALSVPYYHKTVDDADLNRAMLRYEIYMRYYAINMYRIDSPYAFTALGSALAVPVWVYHVVSGLTPKKSGEDFYFLQKLRKYGRVMNWCREKVFPATRLSDRVDFGTGPALIKGMKGDWSSYPIYDYKLFDQVGKTYDMFPSLFKQDILTPMSPFLQSQLNEKELWQSLRDNNNDEKHFVRACHEKVDGLRILQFLKTEQKKSLLPDEELLRLFMQRFFKEKDLLDLENELKYLSFEFSSIYALNRIRDVLMKAEGLLRMHDIAKDSPL